MDESWNIPMGLIIPRRRSTEEARKSRLAGGDGLEPNDFRDVFGGPPRTVFLRRFSGEFSHEVDRHQESVYDEIFQPVERRMPVAGGGRTLPGFQIPAARGRSVRTEVGFYNDIFGSDGGDRRSRSKSKSKSNSSSVLSTELSPIRHGVADEAVFPSFASKLRPINIPTRRHKPSSPSSFSIKEADAVDHPSPPSRTYSIDFTGRPEEAGKMLRQHPHASFSYCFSPPDTNFSHNEKKPFGGGAATASDAVSPASVISSLCYETMGAVGFKGYFNNSSSEKEMEKIVFEVEEGDVDSPFTIEIDCQGPAEAHGAAAAAVDEAIAWAKEKFSGHVSNGPQTT